MAIMVGTETQVMQKMLAMLAYHPILPILVDEPAEKATDPEEEATDIAVNKVATMGMMAVTAVVEMVEAGEKVAEYAHLIR
ncbi:MAG: hypothetical protein QM488_19005 [Rhizobiaceae bacterium]